VREIAAAAPGKPTVDVMDILRWPGIVREDEADTESLQARRARCSARRCATCPSARPRGRAAARADRAALRPASSSSWPQVRARLPRSTRACASVSPSASPSSAPRSTRDRLEQELVLLLQRLDVAEELDRLTGHIEETRGHRGNEPAGRRLDFLMQELNREANTLSSKSQDLETTRIAVDMKVLIEQMREQVQNIE
jgi:uncharacterized protein YicC (UPF0701 family)